MNDMWCVRQSQLDQSEIACFNRWNRPLPGKQLELLSNGSDSYVRRYWPAKLPLVEKELNEAAAWHTDIWKQKLAFGILTRGIIQFRVGNDKVALQFWWMGWLNALWQRFPILFRFKAMKMHFCHYGCICATRALRNRRKIVFDATYFSCREIMNRFS